MTNYIYMDNAATTHVRPEVINAICSCLKELNGNASSLYEIGLQCRAKLEEARAAISHTLNCMPNEIFFTSGGTESDNWAIKGVAHKMQAKGKHIIVSAIEHSAVMESCSFLEKMGYRITYLPVDSYGVVSLHELENSITDETILISIMSVNNEVGTIQPIEAISQLAKHHNIYFHTDAVQGYGKIPINLAELPGISMLSISGHKFNGPKGVGALFIRRGTQLSPLIHGGQQEGNLRAGTENVPSIVGMKTAVELCFQEFDVNTQKLQLLAKRFIALIEHDIPNCIINGNTSNILTGIISITFPGVDALFLLYLLEAENIYVSNGAACNCKNAKASKVLVAMGNSQEYAKSTLRFSLNYTNCMEEIEHVVNVLKEKLALIENIRHEGV